MDILDDMGVSKLSTKVFSKVNYSFNVMQMSLIAHLPGLVLSLCANECL